MSTQPPSPDDLHEKSVTLGRPDFGLRAGMMTWEHPIAGATLRFHSIFLRIHWSGGGILVQTPIQVSVAEQGGMRRIWIVDWTRIALVAILLLTSTAVWRQLVRKSQV